MNDADFHHRHHRSTSGLATGLVIIAIGVFFLLRNLGVELPFVRYHNWWALFILIAAIGPIGQAVQHYRTSGRLDSTVIRHLLSASAIIVVALLFLLDLRWDLWWPVFLIIGGCWMLLRRPEHPESPD